MKFALIRPGYSKVYGKFQKGRQVTSAEPPPLGLCYVGSVLEKAGHNVVIIDAEVDKLSNEEAAKYALNFDPNVVGVTAMTPNIKDAAEIFSFFDASVIRMVGGPHVTALPVRTLHEFRSIDIGVKGESEETIVELAREIEHSKDLNGVKGIVYRKGENVIETGLRQLIQNIDDIPLPAWHLINVGKYFAITAHGEIGKFLTIETSRGCPFRCIFCYPMFSKEVRYRSAKSVVDEIEHVHSEFNTRVIGFVDDTMTLNRPRVLQICDAIIRRGLNTDINWGCTSRVDTVNKEMLVSMKNAGCTRINYGIESGNPKILEITKKGITLEEARKAVKITKEAGIETVAYFIIGHPRETRETIKDTFRFATELNADVTEFSIMTPFPGTELWEMIERKEGEIKIEVSDWSQFGHYGHAVVRVGDLGPDDLLKYQSKLFRDYYVRPSYILSQIRKTSTNPKKLLGLFRSFIAFVETQL